MDTRSLESRTSHRVSELTWAAGFYDGEGSTHLRHIRHRQDENRRYAYVMATISQVDLRPLVRFRNAVGVGTLGGPYTNKGVPNSKPFWRFNTGHADSGEVVRLLAPYLCEPKKEQAVAAIKEANEINSARIQTYGSGYESRR